MTVAVVLLLILAAYLIGSVSSAILVCRAMKLPDPRTHGSNNPGATNVLRLGGKGAAALTLLGDMLKGFIPTLCTALITPSTHVLALVAIAAVAGHLWPVFFQFRGGKGVATALGALLGAAPLTGALALASWMALCLVFRISSVAALGTFLLVPLFLLIQGQPKLAAGFAVVTVLLFITHRANLARLRAGTEPRLGKKSAAGSSN